MIKIKDYELISSRNATPLTIDQVRDFLAIEDDYNDTEISMLIDTVSIKVEQITGRTLITKIYKGYLDCFPTGWYKYYGSYPFYPFCPNDAGIEIQRSKLQSVNSIQYLKDGVLTTFDASKYYITNKQEYSSIYLNNGESWPTDADSRNQAVEINFTAGYGDDACSIPSDLKSAMLRHIALLFENKGDCGNENSISKLIEGLYLPYIISKKFFQVI